MNIYLSEYYCSEDINRNELYEKATTAVINYCAEKSVTLFRSEVYTSYDMLENEIMCSDLFIAIIDDYWTSSTWKSHEYTFAMGYISMHKSSVFGPAIPVVPFIVPGTQIPEFVEKTFSRFAPIHDVPSLIGKINEAYQATQK